MFFVSVEVLNACDPTIMLTPFAAGFTCLLGHGTASTSALPACWESESSGQLEVEELGAVFCLLQECRVHSFSGCAGL